MTTGFHSYCVLVSASLVLIGFFLEIKPFFENARPKPAGLAARGFLWMGTAGLWISVFAGFLLPGKSVVINALSVAESEHRFLGIWSGLVFFAISVWRHLAGRRPIALIALVWLAALGVLGAQIVSGFQSGNPNPF